MNRRLLSTLTVAAAWMAFNSAPVWTQSTPESSKDKQGERTGEEKMEARGAQEPGRMEKERKKGEVEMEARGAQKPGRMEKSGAEGTETKQSVGARWTKEEVKKAQEALKNKGHDPGSIDGVMGPQTVKAIKGFQSANGLKETGRLDAQTAEKLAASSK